MTIEQEDIINLLGEPTQKTSNRLYWKCPYCVDKSQNNLIYTIDNKTIWCYASNGEHTKQLIHELNRKTPDKHYIKSNITEPIKKILTPDAIKRFTEKMLKFNSDLLKIPNAMKILENKRGISVETVKDCFIGIDRINNNFTFPTFEYMTNSVIGFEFRPLNFEKRITRAKGGITGLAQINPYKESAKYLVILGGYLDCYLFYQYMKETQRNNLCHIVTSSNGEPSTLKFLEQSQEYVCNRYNKIILYLDSDKTGIEQMEKIKNKYPFVDIRILTCGCKDFNEHYLKCIKPKMHMPQIDLSEVLKPADIKPYSNSLELNTSNSDGLKNYTINPTTYKLIIDNKFYDIPKFFNVKGAIEGNYKALDYIFSYCGFDIKRFMVKRE